MASLDEILSTVENDDWTAVDGYSIVPYSDDDTILIDASTIASGIQQQILNAGEGNSQYIVFVRDRYQDGIDLSVNDGDSNKLTIYIASKTSDNEYYQSQCVNVEVTDTLIRYGWLVPAIVLTSAGTLQVATYVMGKINGQPYQLTDLYATLTVHESVLSGTWTGTTTPTWAQELITDIINGVDLVNAAVDDVRKRADSGEFDGADGYSPTVTVTDTTSATGRAGHIVSITYKDSDGTEKTVETTVWNGEDGSATVAVDQTLTSGTEIGGVTVDGVRTALFAPTSGGSEKEWSLVGTIESSSGLTVDLSGYTEMILYGSITATAVATLYYNGDKTIFAGFTNNGTRYHYMRFSDNFLGIECAVSKYGTSLTAIGTNATSRAMIEDTKISDITSFNFSNSSSITSCNIAVYAR